MPHKEPNGFQGNRKKAVENAEGRKQEQVKIMRSKVLQEQVKVKVVQATATPLATASMYL